MCVFLRSMCLKIIVERCFRELNMLVGSLVMLYVGLHSCLCFSLLEKLLLKASSTPHRHFLDTLLFVELLKLFLIAISTPGGSIEKAPVSSIASRHLVDRSRSFQPFVDLFLDRSSTATSVDIYYARHLSRHLSIDRDPLACIIFHMFCIFFIIFVSIASCFSFSCRSMVPCSFSFSFYAL